MATTDIFKKLMSLQDILVKKYELEAKVEDAPKQLGTQEEFLSKLKKEFIEKSAEYDSVKDVVSKLKLELDEAVKSRESGEKNMDNITTHREYEALEKQILEATDKENEKRKELQKNEKQLEEINEQLKTYEEMINSQEKDLSESKEALNNQLSDYNAELADLKNQEDEITPDLDQEILFKFQRIIQRNSEGIVAVKNGVCTGCHMILPAQFANVVRETVRDGEKVKFCPYCSRILFWEEAAEGEDESYFKIEDTGSLADFSDEAFEDEEADEDTPEDEENKSSYDSEYDDEVEDEDADDADSENDDDND